MTFFEAAIEVLRWVQKPLDYKAITQFAINRSLLGHVGHTPDIIMASCLIRAIQRSDTGALIRLPTGEFALRGWPDEILNKTSEQAIPEGASTVEFPPVHVGFLNENEAVPLLESDDIQFRKAVQLKFDNEIFASDEEKADEDWVDSEHSQFEQLREELNAQHNEHFNLCAAIVKMLRRASTPMRSAAMANMLSQTSGSIVYEQSIVLAMRADNALRVSRGKRAIFMHIPPDLWTLSENFLARHILRLESRMYDMSRQLRLYSLHALSIKLRELSPQAWLQLAAIILKHLNYTIISQCETSESVFIFRAEEARGLTYLPVIIRVQHSLLVGTDDIIQFRDIIRELGYEHGVLLTNGEVSRDALNECTTKELPIYAYSARQIAPIMLDARIGVIPNELPIVFIDNNFFHALSVQVDEPSAEGENVLEKGSLLEETNCMTDVMQDVFDDDVSSGEFIFDTNFDEKSI